MRLDRNRPEDRRLGNVYRFGAALTGGALVVLGLLGAADRAAFLTTEGEVFSGVSTTEAVGFLMVAFGSLLLGGALVGGTFASTVNIVLGAVFVLSGTLFGSVGRELIAYQRELSIVTGLLVIVLGLAFVGGLRFLQRDVRVHAVPAVGLGMAPVLGVFFAVGWTPCIGPTLAAVLGLSVSADDATAARGALLAFVYCLGLGIPFLLAALGFSRFSRSVRWIREHQRGVSIAGGVLLIAVGVLLVTGVWDSLVTDLMNWVGGFETAL